MVKKFILTLTVSSQNQLLHSLSTLIFESVLKITIESSSPVSVRFKSGGS